MSAAGKSVLSKLVYDELKNIIPNVVLLDGDVLRQVFGNDSDHTVEGREKNARRLSNLSKFLTDQDIHVVAAVLSIFPEWQMWNRDNIKDYVQIYIKVPFDVLVERETKDLYKNALDGKVENVVGVDIKFPEPVENDLIIDNSQDKENFNSYVQNILSIDVISKVLDQQ